MQILKQTIGFFAVSLATASLGAEPAHPVLETLSGSVSSADNVLNTWTEAEYVSNFVPQQAPRRDVAVNGMVRVVVPGDTSWSWDENDPHRITSLPSGTTFPGAAGYPLQYQTVQVKTGSVEVPYYIAAGTSSTRSLVHAQIDGDKSVKIRRDLKHLAYAYMQSGNSHATRNQAYARRIAAILYEWSLEFPNYFMTEMNKPIFIDYDPAFVATELIQRASTFNGFFQEWLDEEIHAFDAIYDSLIWPDIDADKGVDVRDAIINNLFFVTGDYFLDHVPPAVGADSNLPYPNMVFGKVAHVLNRPDYIEWVDEYIVEVLVNKLMRDSTISEGMGYSQGFLYGTKTVADAATDYFSDRPADTPELVAIQSNLNDYAARLDDGIGRFETLALPTGQLPSIGDTEPREWFDASNQAQSSFIPAYGALAFGTGSNDEAVMMHQIFAGDNNHMRSDTTAFTLWAFGEEVLGNIRYHNRAAGRQYGEQMLSHNTVTIDRENATLPSADTYGTGDLTLLEPGNNGLALSEIDGERAYENEADRFQRIMLLNTDDIERPYVLDVFRVTGGKTHDYVLHASIMYDSSWECSIPLTLNPDPHPLLEGGEQWVTPTDRYEAFEYYGVWTNVSEGTTSQDFQITYRDDSTDDRDIRLWMTTPGDTSIHIGDTPVPARTSADKHRDNIWELDLWRPSSILRRRISSGTLNSLFVSVIEPLNGQDNVASVERLPVAGDSDEACAVKVTLTDGRVDTYLVNLHNPSVEDANHGSAFISTENGAYTLNGRVGCYSVGPHRSKVWTMGASSFETPEQSFSTSDRTYSGTISGSTRTETGGTYDAFKTSTALPVGTALRGKYLLINYGTLDSPSKSGISSNYEIDQVIQDGSDYLVVVKHDHYLKFTGTTRSDEQVAPYRRFNGTHSFEITTSASADQITGLEEVEVAVNANSGPIPFSFGSFDSIGGGALQVTATSANTGLIPNAGLTLGGSGTNRTLTIQPAANQSGETDITITVTDGIWTMSRTFPVFVGDGPATISPIPAQTMVQNGVLELPFHVSDASSTSEQLTTAVYSSNTNLVPLANLQLSYDHSSSTENRVLTIEPLLDRQGSTVMTVEVNDGTQTTTQDFLLMVLPSFQPFGLVGHWPLDEGTGSITADLSGYGNHGALVNVPVWGSDGTRDSFIHFDGNDDRVSTTFEYALSSIDNFTWAWWANKQSPAGTDSTAIMVGNRYPEYSTGNKYGFIKLAPDRAEFANAATSGGIDKHDYADVPQGDWHHYAMVKTGTSYQWYVDGVAEGSPTNLPYSEDRPIPFLIGGDDNGTGRTGEHFQGYIDDVVLYNRALTTEDLENVKNGIYDQTITLVELGTHAYWDNGSHWSDGLPAHEGAAYVVPDTGNLRSESGSATFPGNELIIQPGGKLHIRAKQSQGEITVIQNLILNGGIDFSSGELVRLAAGEGTSETNVLDGVITQSGCTQIESFGDTIARSLKIASEIHGSGRLQAWEGLSSGGNHVIVENPANTFSGNWEVGAGSTLLFTDPDAIGTAEIHVLDEGKLTILGDWQSAGTLTVADQAMAQVDLGAYAWSVSNVVFGGSAVADGDYDAAELNALGTHSVFIGTGTLRVGAGDPRTPIGHWKFDEGSGTVATDSSGNGYTGTIKNGANWASDRARASYLSFDGSNDRVETLFTVDLTATSGDFSWAVWAKNQAAPDNGIIIGNRKPDLNGNLNFFKLTTRRVNYAGGNSQQNVEFTDMDQAWHHHAIVKSGSTLSYYQDGAFVNSGEITTFAEGLYPFYMGGDPNDGTAGHFQGFIDDVVLYRFALTSNEVMNVKNGIYGDSEPLEPPMLDFGMSGGDMVFNWTGSVFKVQSCTNLTEGTWIDVPGGDTPPVTNSTADPEAFFRLIKE